MRIIVIVIVAAFMTVIVLFDLSCLSFVARVLRQVIEVGIYPFCRILIMKDAGLGKGPHESAVKALDEVAERALTLHNEDTAERVYAYLYDCDRAF